MRQAKRGDSCGITRALAISSQQSNQTNTRTRAHTQNVHAHMLQRGGGWGNAVGLANNSSPNSKPPHAGFQASTQHTNTCCRLYYACIFTRICGRHKEDMFSGREISYTESAEERKRERKVLERWLKRAQPLFRRVSIIYATTHNASYDVWWGVLHMFGYSTCCGRCDYCFWHMPKMLAVFHWFEQMEKNAKPYFASRKAIHHTLL